MIIRPKIRPEGQWLTQELLLDTNYFQRLVNKNRIQKPIKCDELKSKLRGISKIIQFLRKIMKEIVGNFCQYLKEINILMEIFFCSLKPMVERSSSSSTSENDVEDCSKVISCSNLDRRVVETLLQFGRAELLGG